MAFSISGRIAGGAQDALNEVLERRLKEHARRIAEAEQQQRVREHADNLAMQQERLGFDREQEANLQADRNAQRLLQARPLDLAELKHREDVAKEATQKNVGMDMSNVMNMPGMTDQQKKGELAGALMRNPGMDMPKTVVDLLKLDPKMYNVTVPGPGGEPREQLFTEDELRRPGGVRAYKPPSQLAPRTPYFVQLPDGSFRDVMGVAPPGSQPAPTAAGIQKQSDADDAKERSRKAMQQYGEDMLDVINDLLDDKGNLQPQVKAVVGGFQGVIPEMLYPSMEYKTGDRKATTAGAFGAINRLKSKLDISTLNDMKQQSRTGATGFGALTAPELKIIEDAASLLNYRNMSEEEYARELRRIRDAILLTRMQSPTGGSDDADMAEIARRREALANRKK